MDPLQVTSTPSVVHDIVNSSINFEENFDELMSKLKVSITLSTDDAEKKRKITMINKMVASFNICLNESGVQSMDNAFSKLHNGSLTIYSSGSRGRGKGRKCGVIGLPK